MFTVAEAKPMLSTPRTAARRGAPGVTASAAAIPSHRREWSADFDNVRSARSSVGVGLAAIAR